MSIHKQLDKIEELRISYKHGTRRKLMPKEITSWNKLLKGDTGDLSSGRKSVFKRAHKFATAIQRKLGSEVLLLVLSSLNRTQMAGYDEKPQLQKALREWWNRVEHPPALKDAAMCLLTAQLEEVDDEEVDDEEVDDEEVDTNTLKIMEHARGIMLLAQDILDPHDRDLWIASGQTQLHALEKLTCKAPENWVTMSDRDTLTKYLRGSLFEGVQESYMAKLGAAPACVAVHLRLASGEHEDFILELWLGLLYGSSVSEAMKKMTSVEDWRPILGDFLYTAMSTSRLRTTGEDSAVKISSPFGSSFDYRLRVAMRFVAGNELWATCYA